MAEKSQFWYTNGFAGATGDGAAPYTQEEFRSYNDEMHGEGVVADALNELAVSGVATPLTVATGRAMVNGFHYVNDAAKTLVVTTPSVGTTGGRVVLRANWAAATVRLFVLLNTDGNAGIPALTQTSGATYEISLASFTVTTGGVITLTDTRTFAASPLARMMPQRQGGASGTWQTDGATNYTIPMPRMSAGATETNLFTAEADVTFPTAFSSPPLVFALTNTTATRCVVSDVTASGFTVTTYAVADETTLGGVAVIWQALGEV